MRIMKSHELKSIKEVEPEKKKKILFINPKRKDTGFNCPHNGLALLAAILKKRGHEVLIADYVLMREEKNTDISFFINKFNPDIAGVSSYTQNANEFDGLISRIHEINPVLPIMVGGPHPTLYSNLLEKNKNIDYIFVGEAELTILGVVESAKKQKKPKIIKSEEIVDLNDLPFPDYKAFYRWESIRGYPIMTSRGCPNKCSFCAAANLSYRRWRFRKVEECIRELELAKETLSPHIFVYIYDDNPMVWKERFHEFLDMFSKRIKNTLTIINTRADGIDETMLELMKKCGCTDIFIGVEHANQEVYELINKGETLEEIERACKLIKKHNFALGLSFVVGLPKDNLEKIKDSIRFCKKMRPAIHTINPIVPYRGTAARKWFEEHGAKLYDEVDGSNQQKELFECDEPLVETEDFSLEDRKKAYYMFLFKTVHNSLRLKKLPKIFSIARKYKLYHEFFFWLPRGILKSLSQERKFFKLALNIYKKEGFFELLRRYKYRNRQ